MPLWKNSLMTGFFHTVPSEETECEVRIDDHEILVEYNVRENGKDLIKQYRGVNNGTGHFKLHMSHDGSSGTASLHMFPESTLLVGNWVEDSLRGMWSIKLA
jgi:hypothetical protein